MINLGPEKTVELIDHPFQHVYIAIYENSTWQKSFIGKRKGREIAFPDLNWNNVHFDPNRPLQFHGYEPKNMARAELEYLAEIEEKARKMEEERIRDEERRVEERQQQWRPQQESEARQRQRTVDLVFADPAVRQRIVRQTEELRRQYREDIAWGVISSSDQQTCWLWDHVVQAWYIREKGCYKWASNREDANAGDFLKIPD